MCLRIANPAINRVGSGGRPGAIHQGPKALACPLRRGYSLHRDAPCWAPGAKPEARFLIAQAGCIPTEISSNVTPSPPLPPVERLPTALPPPPPAPVVVPPGPPRLISGEVSAA